MPNIILPGGHQKFISTDQTVNEILIDLIGENNHDSRKLERKSRFYIFLDLVFFGKKLPIESKLKEIEFLNDDANVYLVHRPLQIIDSKKCLFKKLSVDEMQQFINTVARKIRRNDYKKVTF